VSQSIPQILIIDDELGGDDTAKRRAFCDAMGLVEHVPGRELSKISDDALAIATFVSAQQTDENWTSNEIGLALDAISTGWPFSDGSRWALICVDMNFSYGEKRKKTELFGRKIFEALRNSSGSPTGGALESLERLPVIMFSSDTPENVESQLGSTANVPVIPKWGGGTDDEKFEARRAFSRVLFKEALIEDASLRYVRDDNRIDKVPRENPIIGSSLELLEALRKARRILARGKNARILVTGERGAGKELLVGYLHAYRAIALQLGNQSIPTKKSGESGDKLVVVHLKETPPELFTAALKGHKQGAFTGASGHVDGPIKVSGWGTVHLDEIGNLRAGDLQILLRLVESDSYSPVGSSESIKINCQFVATTNKDVTAMLERDEFPPDLYDRFEKLTMPPLRDRPDDIRSLFEAFLNREVEKIGCRPKRVDDDVWDRMRQEQWNGNVRQLKSVAETIVSDREYTSRVRIADFDQAWSQTGDVVRAGWQGAFDELIELIEQYEVTAHTPLDSSCAKLEKAKLKLWKSLTIEAIDRDRGSRPNAPPQRTAIVRLLTGEVMSSGDADRWLQKMLTQWTDAFGLAAPDGEIPSEIFEILGNANREKVEAKGRKRTLPS
jgi:DNA-binding NtrC family response regulator